jgi:hypothetical protein
MSERAGDRRRMGDGLVALAASAVLLVGGAGGFAALVALAGAACCALGARRAVERDRANAAAPPLDARSAGLHAAVAADLALATAWEATAYFRRVPALAGAAADVEQALARWNERGLLAAPERAHALPPPLEKVSVEPLTVRGAGDVEMLSFASEFEPADPEIAQAYQAEHANRTARVVLLRHRGGAPRPVLISVHGFGMGRLASDFPWLRVRGWDLVGLHRELGVDVAYAILPFHGPRTDGPSGAGFFDRHPLFAPSALAQAVWELRRLVGWLRAQGAPAVAVHGISLGGCTAALLASLDATLAAAVPMTPAVDLAAIFWEQLPPARRREWIEAGLGPERVAAAWSLVAPLRMRPAVPHAGRLVIGAAADQIARPDGVRALWSHWGEPAVHWLPGAHLLWRGGDAFALRVHKHLRETLLAAPSPAAGPPLSRFRAG